MRSRGLFSMTGLFFLLMSALATGTGWASVEKEIIKGVLVLQGMVYDPHGMPVPEVLVSIRELEVGLEESQTTNFEGRFRFENLPAGDYQVTANRNGFARFEQQVDLRQSRSRFVVRLEMARFAQEVRVTARMPDLDSEAEVPGEELEERAVRDVAEFLRGQPGLFSFRRGPINLEPSIRGLQSGQMAMFVDGTRTFAAGPGRMDSDISHVSPNQVQTVLVVKGPYALTWGAGALSAIRLDTFRPGFSGETFRANGRLAFNYGENGDVGDGVASVWGASDRFRFALLHNTRTGSDYRDGSGNTIPGDYQSYDTRWDFGWRANPETLIEYSGGYQEQRDIDYPGRILDASFFKTQSHAVEMTWNPAGTVLSQVYTQFFVNLKEHLMNNDNKPTALPMAGRMPPFGIQVDLPTQSDTYGGRFHMSLDQGAWSSKLGLDFYNLDQAAERSISRRDIGMLLFQDIVWPDASTKDWGGYGQLVYERGGAQIGGTVRLDLVDASAGEVSEFFAENTTGSLNQNETNLSAALSGAFRMTDHWTLTAGVGRAVRTSTALERYSDRFPSTQFQVSAEFMGHPGLKPEKSLEWNLGTAIQIAETSIEGDFYYRTIDDYITVVADPSLTKRLPLSPNTVFRYINGTEARFTGFELRAERVIGNYANAFGWLGYVWAEDELLDEPVFGIPPLEGRAGLQLHTADRKRWVEIGVTSVAAQERVASTRLEAPTKGWTVFDVRAGLAIRSDWRVRVGVENIGNQDYVTHLNALNPFTRERIGERGRYFYVGLEYAF